MSVSNPLIRELKRYTSSFLDDFQRNKAISDEHKHIIHFENCLENIFFMGLQEPSSFMSLMRNWDPWTWITKTTTYSKVPDHCTKLQDIIDQVKSRYNIQTNDGRFRFLVRHCLVTKCLHVLLENFKACGKYKHFYSPDSILGDEILAEILLSVLYQCSQIKFALDLTNTAFMDLSWELPKIIHQEVVPTHSLGISLTFSGNRAIILRIRSNSVISEYPEISVGDVVEKLNDQYLTSAARGKFHSLMRAHRGKPLSLTVIKAMAQPNGVGPFHPAMIKLYRDINVDPEYIRNRIIQCQYEASEFKPIAKMKLWSGFKVMYMGRVHVGKHGDIHQIDKAFSLLMSSPNSGKVERSQKKKIEVIFEVGELGVKYFDARTSELVGEHSFMEISSCGGVTQMPNYFSYIAGNEYCNICKNFKCFIFLASNANSAPIILQGIASDNLLVEEHIHRSIWKCCRRNDILTTEMLNQMLADILKYCLTHRMDSYKVHMDRMKGVILIRKISKRSNYSDMGITQIIALLWACLSVVHHFHIRVIPDKGYRSWYRKRQYLDAMLAYERVLLMLLPQLFTTVIKSIITFFNEAKIWDMESYITNCIKKILLICKDSESIINHLMDIVDTTDGITDARNVLKIINNLCVYVQWKDIDDYVIYRLLETYRRSIMYEELESLKWGMEECLRFAFNGMPRSKIIKGINVMLEWIGVLEPGTSIEFGNLMEHAAGLNNNEPFSTNLAIDFMTLVMDLIASSDWSLSLLGCRILFYLLDRQKNEAEFLTPKVYFEDTYSELCVGKYDLNDRNFIESLNSLLHNNLITALMKHGERKTCAEAIFAAIAVIVVEIPCSFTAASAVSFAMAAQEFILSAPEFLDEHGYKIHACVIFIMTLVCYVHKAGVFYTYVNKILALRAQLAPQLNPPIWKVYDSHPLQISRSDLYFEDWEARYGLYHCFIKGSDDEDCKEKQGIAKFRENYKNMMASIAVAFKRN